MLYWIRRTIRKGGWWFDNVLISEKRVLGLHCSLLTQVDRYIVYFVQLIAFIPSLALCQWQTDAHVIECFYRKAIVFFR